MCAAQVSCGSYTHCTWCQHFKCSFQKEAKRERESVHVCHFSVSKGEADKIVVQWLESYLVGYSTEGALSQETSELTATEGFRCTVFPLRQDRRESWTPLPGMPLHARVTRAAFVTNIPKEAALSWTASRTEKWCHILFLFFGWRRERHRLVAPSRSAH